MVSFSTKLLQPRQTPAPSFPVAAPFATSYPSISGTCLTCVSMALSEGVTNRTNLALQNTGSISIQSCLCSGYYFCCPQSGFLSVSDDIEWTSWAKKQFLSSVYLDVNSFQITSRSTYGPTCADACTCVLENVDVGGYTDFQTYANIGHRTLQLVLANTSLTAHGSVIFQV